MMLRNLLLWVVAVWLGGCALLPTGAKKDADHSYLLAPSMPAPSASTQGQCGKIQVGGGAGASGFRSRRMAYMRSDYEVEYFAFAHWADPPARLLSEQVRRYFDRSGAFDAVLSAPVAARTDLHLELGDVMLVQRFSGNASTVALELHARLYGADRSIVRLSRRFAHEEAAGGDPQSGVQAANRAVAELLPDLLSFVESACGNEG